ncbi:alpha/beta-hydrolase [Aspergillus saccharolyticus JOP 1030-1]|uniref:Alpha/beta-hydrolase n=1 Tax=Aspergillus saccharolyticus JOP 1030-1 TaxID=1450539 RepID=A0A318ZCZ8_9EURO|nr:alpha/beta-hydrolase [Aspergillus saccharolyticus JOP 1030-1]PYH42523.1 alpha/beta-hydrolase [Aspergillus saccharolyticus JOP 1030-1]
MRDQWTLQRLRRGSVATAIAAISRTTPRTCPPWHASRATIPAATIRRLTTAPRAHHHHRFKHFTHPLPTTIPPQKRTLLTSTLPPILIPPTIFIGLLLALWTWKCIWIVLLQDKLLYLSWLPPLSRSETIAAYEPDCRPVQWTTQQIRSLDGTKLTVCEGRLPPLPTHESNQRRVVVICYFQGNGGSTPLRLPLLSQTLRTLAPSSRQSQPPEEQVDYIIVALSYRGYWTSSGRASQKGIERDAQAFLGWVMRTYAASAREVSVVLWGHSLGAAIASTALATHLCDGGGEVVPVASPHAGRDHAPGVVVAAAAAAATPLPIRGLVLEAPSASVKDMLISLYPQKWLPYRYLWPFLWNHWDGVAALRRMAAWRDQRQMPIQKSGDGASAVRRLPPILLLTAEKDEVIPPEAAAQLEEEARRLRIEMVRTEVAGAMHTEAPVRPVGRRALVEFILRCSGES